MFRHAVITPYAFGHYIVITLISLVLRSDGFSLPYSVLCYFRILSPSSQLIGFVSDGQLYLDIIQGLFYRSTLS